MKNFYVNCFLFFTIFSVFDQVNGQNIDSYFDTGLQEKINGKWSEALNVWAKGRLVLDEQGKVDPRIAFAFIETVTEKKLKHFYETASEIYHWGLDAYSFYEFRQDYIDEGERAIPLLPEEMAKKWRQLINNNNSELISQIREFWIKKDPTPTTAYNERLIEHWERITYAREKFNMNKYSPYKTDDRGIIYVKYGKPYHIKKGNFDGNGRYAKYAEYEVWLYDNLYEYEPVFYLFGAGEHTSFGLRKGVEEFIANSAFLLINRTGNKLPGTSLQLEYYRELSILGGEYEERLQEIEMAIREGVRSPMVFKSMRDRFEMREEENYLQHYAPKDVSVVGETIHPIEIKYTHARFLNKEDKPYLAVVAMAYPTNLNQEYSLTNTLIIKDKNWNEVKHISDNPKNVHDNTSTFLIAHTDSTLNYILASEAIPDTAKYRVTSVGDTVKTQFIGKALLNKKAPLAGVLSDLELSDLITGIAIPGNAQLSNYPFPVLPSSQLSKYDTLHVYFEVYHLFTGPRNISEFSVEFSVLPKYKGNIFARLLGRGREKDVVAQHHSFTSKTTTSKEVIKFDLSELKGGDYEFVIQVTDNVSKQSKFRASSFEILKN